MGHVALLQDSTASQPGRLSTAPDAFDPVGPAAYKLFGSTNYMWASDFPHTDSTWPDTKKEAEELMAGVPQEAVDKIMRANAIRMLSLSL